MRILKTKNGEGYVWLAVLVLFLSLLTSVLLLYLGLCGQVLNERREKKQALDSYLAEFAKASYDAIRQGDRYWQSCSSSRLQPPIWTTASMGSSTMFRPPFSSPVWSSA